LRGASLMMQTVQTIQRPLWTSESPKVPGKSPSNHAHKANKHTHTNDKHRYSMNFHDPADFTQVCLATLIYFVCFSSILLLFWSRGARIKSILPSQCHGQGPHCLQRSWSFHDGLPAESWRKCPLS
jgi:hypothetical protein